MAETQSCAVCGCETGGGPGDELCPKCLLSLGVGDDLEEGNQSPDLAYLLAEPRTSGAVKFFSFGKYELLEEIARGGMGVVFRAWDKSLHRVVAVKFLRREALASSAGLQRFRLEAKTAASLRHAHIVPIYEFGEHEGHPYVTMDFMKESLAEQVAKGAGAAPDFTAICNAAGIVVKIAGALQYAHAKGVLHRDIKPGNILLDEHGEPRLTDFGLAKILDQDSGLTVKGEVIGTPSYISPEQAEGNSELTPATDVYGLGATLYELITGKPPFVGATKLETLNMVLERMPARPRALNQAVPPALEVILRTCLAKEQTARYATAQDLATDLKWFLDNRRELKEQDAPTSLAGCTATYLERATERKRAEAGEPAVLETQRVWRRAPPLLTIPALLVFVVGCAIILLKWFPAAPGLPGEGPTYPNVTTLQTHLPNTHVIDGDLSAEQRNAAATVASKPESHSQGRTPLEVSIEDTSSRTTGVFLAGPPRAPENSLMHQTPMDADLKAAFLYNILKYVSYPTNAFSGASTPYRILADDSPLTRRFPILLRDKLVNGRKIQVAYFLGEATGADFPHVAFIQGDSLVAEHLIESFKEDKPILTVSDSLQFLEHGGMIQLITVSNTVRFRINTNATAKAGLVVSDKLSRLAHELVSGPDRLQ